MTGGAQGDNVADHRIKGSHVFMDYTGAFFEEEDAHRWVLSVLQQAVVQSPATEVHAHCVPFDGTTSPPGFAAVVLIDESHITAHHYADRERPPEFKGQRVCFMKFGGTLNMGR